jgi:ribonuclease HII
MSSRNRIRPDLSLEFELRAQGLQQIAGIDEAGRGALAGPVVAAAVILPLDRFGLLRELQSVNDSKQLSVAQRVDCECLIRSLANSIAIGKASVQEIDELGILAATRLAMCRAIEDLADPVDHLLIDYVKLPELPIPQTAVVRGDATALSIAAASIIAKQTRDRSMIELDRDFPGYGFASHKGYGTVQHRSMLAKLGPSQAHRRSFAPVRISSEA